MAEKKVLNDSPMTCNDLILVSSANDAAASAEDDADDKSKTKKATQKRKPKSSNILDEIRVRAICASFSKRVEVYETSAKFNSYANLVFLSIVIALLSILYYYYFARSAATIAKK